MQQAETELWRQSPTLLWSRQHGAYILARLWVVQRNREALAHLERFYPVNGTIGAAPGSSYSAQTETWGMAYIRYGCTGPCKRQSRQAASWLRCAC